MPASTLTCYLLEYKNTSVTNLQKSHIDQMPHVLLAI